MKSTDIYKALSEVDEDILDRSEKAAERKVIPFRRRIVMAVAAVIAVVVLMGAAAVVTHWESAKDWVAWRWQQMTDSSLSKEQITAVENYYFDVGVSQTVNGVTITVDSAVIYDREIEVLLKVDGVEEKEGEDFKFGSMFTEVNSVPEGNTTFGNGSDIGGCAIPISIGFDDMGDTNAVDVSVQIIDIIDMGFRRRTVVEGEWNLEFTLEKSAFTKIKLPDTDISVEYIAMNEPFKELPQKIDESCTENGITVTADSAKFKEVSLNFLYGLMELNSPRNSVIT